MIIRRLEALFGFKVDINQFKQATSAVDRFANNANKAMGVLAGHFAIQTINDFVSSTTEAMANVGKTAGYLGLSTDALSELRYAAEKSGVSIYTLDDSMKELQIRAVDAKAGTGEAAEAFQALGMSTTDAAGNMRAPLELLSEVADRLQELPTQSERIWVVDSMFGDQGAEMLKMLKDGSAGVAKMRGEAKELGYVMGGDSIDAAIKFKQAMTKLKASLGGFLRKFLGQVMPIMTNFIERTSGFWDGLAKSFAKLNENTTIVRTALLALAGVFALLAAQAVVAFAPIIAIGAIIAGVAMLIDDLWTAFKGGESVAGRVFATLKNWFYGLKRWGGDVVKGIWNYLPLSLKKNLNAAYTFFVNFWQNLSSGFRVFYGRVAGFAKQYGPKMLDGFLNIASDIWEAFKTLGKRIGQVFVERIDAALSTIRAAINIVRNLFDFAVPDFVKKGFSAAVEYVDGVGSKYDKNPSQRAYAPNAPAISQAIQHNNQNISVAVNMKSNANPQEVGVEVSKVVRRELEKERINAYMGVSNAY